MLDAQILWVTIAGGMGAVARYGGDLWIKSEANRVAMDRSAKSGLPPHPAVATFGILGVNMVGCALAGLVFGLSFSAHLPLLSAVLGAFLSGYTTFSTAMVDVLKLRHAGHRRSAFAHWMGTLVLCLACAYLGLGLGLALSWT